MNSKTLRYFTTEDDGPKISATIKNSGNDEIATDTAPLQFQKQNLQGKPDKKVSSNRDKTRQLFSKQQQKAEHEFVEREKIDGLTSTFQEKKQYKRRIKHQFVAEHSKRAAILLPEEKGYIDLAKGESTCKLSQKDIVANVDIATASKHFSLDLVKFGPYKIDYTRSGRYLLLGGKFGHVAAIDWLTKDLLCEINVMESVRDVKWLHNELMFAVAQKTNTYLYDSQGTEIHCLKKLHRVLQLDFLPYHFILAASCESSFLHWVDVSIGKLVTSFPSRCGPLKIMRQNPTNAILHCGQSSGIVSLWSPNVKEALVKMVCHRGPISSLSIDQSGKYMATSSTDRLIKIWDLRMLRPLYEYKLLRSADNLAFSQNKFLACSVGPDIQVFENICEKPIDSPYLMHKLNDLCTDLQFCPYEDVLGVGFRTGFTSLLVPGAGEANLDVYEPNPFQSKNQRREGEVRSLLDKIQPEMIALDDDLMARIDQKSVDEVLRDKLDVLINNKVSNTDIMLKHRAKGKSDPSKMQKRRQLVRTARQRELILEQKMVRNELVEEGILEPEQHGRPESKHVLDRFKRRIN